MIAAPERIPSPLTRLRQTVSATRLGLFLQCRLKFFFRYIQQIKKPLTPRLASERQHQCRIRHNPGSSKTTTHRNTRNSNVALLAHNA